MAGTKSNGTEFSLPTFPSIAVIFLALARLGDRVPSGADVDIDGEKHLILQENEILGVVEK